MHWQRTFLSSTSTTDTGHEQLHTKKQKLDQEVGFDALSTHKKCKLMTFSRTRTASGMRQLYLDLLKQRKDDRYSWFENNIMTLLRMRAPEAFENFAITSDFIDSICDGNFTDTDPQNDWWDGLVGNSQKRDKEEVQNLNRIAKALRTGTYSLQINPAQLHKLNPKAPVPITDMDELKDFLLRLHHLSSTLFLTCETGSAAKSIHSALIHDGTHRILKNDPNWMRDKPREIVYYLLGIERAEFKHIIVEEDFLDTSMSLDFYQHPGIKQLVANCMIPNRTVTDGQLPWSLRPVNNSLAQQPPNPPRQELAPVLSQHQASRAPQQRNGPYDNRANAQQRNNRQPPQRRNNPQHHPLLQQFWRGVPEARSRDPLARWCRLANTNTGHCRNLLGLAANDCGHYYIRGYCMTANCSYTHTPRALQQQQVAEVVGLMTEGLRAAN